MLKLRNGFQVSQIVEGMVGTLHFTRKILTGYWSSSRPTSSQFDVRIFFSTRSQFAEWEKCKKIETKNWEGVFPKNTGKRKGFVAWLLIVLYICRTTETVGFTHAYKQNLKSVIVVKHSYHIVTLGLKVP